MLLSMNRDPIVFAMANPTPEIDYNLAVQTRDDVIMGTGRSDYPNQINNVIAFPFIFRGALDSRATEISDDMKMAAARAIAGLARQPITEEAGFDGTGLEFGRTYLIPKPFDRRLLVHVASAVAECAMKSGLARKTFDIDEYREKLSQLAKRDQI
jgi:malate dehydrogenase (oxaloacetate-decarboxylating)(NADP+)